MTSNSKAFSFDMPFSNMQATLLLCASMCVFCQQVILFPPKHNYSCKVEKVFSKLADFSYSLYLIHRILLMIVFTFFFNKEEADLSVICLLQYLAIIAGVMIVTYAIYYVTERRTSDVKHWLKRKLDVE